MNLFTLSDVNISPFGTGQFGLLATEAFSMKRRRTNGMNRPRKRVFRRRAGTMRRGRKRSRTTGVFANPRIGGFLGTEIKFYDTSLTSQAISSTSGSSGGELNPSATIVFNSVTQGDGESQRDGRQIVMKNLSIKGTVSVVKSVDETALQQPCLIFLALVLDTQTNGAAFNSEDVYKNKAGSVFTCTSMFRNLENSRRFTVLKTKILSFQHQPAVHDGTNIEFGGMIKRFEMFVNLGAMRVNYNGTTETVANITDNSLQLMGFCTSADMAPLLHYNARLRFVG